MLEFWQFIFGSFWRWLGFYALLVTVTHELAAIVTAFRQPIITTLLDRVQDKPDPSGNVPSPPATHDHA